MTEYVATAEAIVYYDGATGDPSTVDGTFPPDGKVDLTLRSTFSDPEIVGCKVVIDADGTGDLFFEFDAFNPDPPNDWTADPIPDHIALHNDYDFPTSYLHVSGPTHYEYEFFSPGDPMFGAFTFNDFLDDFLKSLAAGTGPDDAWATGTLRAVFENTETITVSRFDLVFFTPVSTVAPPCQIYPRDDDQGAGTAAIWPPPSSGQPGSYY